MRADTVPGRAALTASMGVRAPAEWAVPFLPLPVLERLQARRLRATIAHAYEHVPHYRETLRKLGLTPDDIRTAADLRRLPTVERADYVRDPERFVSRHADRSLFVTRESGGSRAAPLRVGGHAGGDVHARRSSASARGSSRCAWRGGSGCGRSHLVDEPPRHGHREDVPPAFATSRPACASWRQTLTIDDPPRGQHRADQRVRART